MIMFTRVEKFDFPYKRAGFYVIQIAVIFITQI